MTCATCARHARDLVAQRVLRRAHLNAQARGAHIRDAGPRHARARGEEHAWHRTDDACSVGARPPARIRPLSVDTPRSPRSPRVDTHDSTSPCVARPAPRPRPSPLEHGEWSRPGQLCCARPHGPPQGYRAGPIRIPTPFDDAGHESNLPLDHPRRSAADRGFPASCNVRVVVQRSRRREAAADRIRPSQCSRWRNRCVLPMERPGSALGAGGCGDSVSPGRHGNRASDGVAPSRSNREGSLPLLRPCGDSPGSRSVLRVRCGSPSVSLGEFEPSRQLSRIATIGESVASRPTYTRAFESGLRNARAQKSHLEAVSP